MLAAAALALLAAPATAQIVLPPSADPGALQQREIEERRRREEAERLQRKPITDPIKREGLEAPPVKAAPDAVRFFVREIEFTPSKILSRDELESIARDFRGKTLAFVELSALTQRINALYREKGVVTAQAVIPPQDISSGVVRVRLVEGIVGSYHIDGNRSTNSAYIRWHLREEPGSIVDLKALERDLVRFNRTNDVQLRAELKPGAEFGTTDIYLTAVEPDRHIIRATLDNAGSRSTGLWQEGVTYINRSALGFRDELTYNATYSHGHQGYSVAYAVPFNPWGGRITAAYYQDHTAIKYGALEPLDITGRADALLFGVRQPVYTYQGLEISLTGGGKQRYTTNTISGQLLSNVKTEDINFGTEIQAVDGYGSWFASYARTVGHDYVLGVKQSYTLGRGNLRRTQDLGHGFAARANIAFQHSHRELLPSSEQLLIGGEGTVRGFGLGTFSGDEGIYGNVELHHPLFSFGEAPGPVPVTASGFFFYDYGLVRPFRPPESVLRREETLASVGWGMNFALYQRVYARVTYAHQLRNLPLEPRRYYIYLQLAVSVL